MAESLLAQLAAAPYVSGDGRVELSSGSVRLAVGPSQGNAYSDAQLDDYRVSISTPEHDRPEAGFRWRPPVRLSVRARFSHGASELRGTAGFGFWNDPVGMTGRVRLRPPQAVWFFLATEPSQMPLVLDQPGRGWMASALDVRGRELAYLALLAPMLVVAMRVPRLKAWIWPWLRRRMRLAGELLPDAGRWLTAWRDYVLTWEPDRARFAVDGETVAILPVAPRGPLGLVIWIDTQFLIATPRGELRSGVTACPTQWLEIASLDVETL